MKNISTALWTTGSDEQCCLYRKSNLTTIAWKNTGKLNYYSVKYTRK